MTSFREFSQPDPVLGRSLNGQPAASRRPKERNEDRRPARSRPRLRERRFGSSPRTRCRFAARVPSVAFPTWSRRQPISRGKASSGRKAPRNSALVDEEPSRMPLEICSLNYLCESQCQAQSTNNSQRAGSPASSAARPRATWPTLPRKRHERRDRTRFQEVLVNSLAVSTLAVVWPARGTFRSITARC